MDLVNLNQCIINQSRELDPVVAEATEILGRVHKLPDPKLLEFNLRFLHTDVLVGTGGAKVNLIGTDFGRAFRLVGGKYFSAGHPQEPQNDYYGGPEIWINTTSIHKTRVNTLLHEVWHFLQKEFLTRPDADSKTLHAYERFHGVATNCDEYRALRRDHKALEYHHKRSLAEGVDAKATEVLGFNLERASYEADTDEWLARCYVYWILHTSGASVARRYRDRAIEERSLYGRSVYPVRSRAVRIAMKRLFRAAKLC